MDNSKSFLLYASTEKQVSVLNDEDAGKLFKAIFAYNRTGEKPDLPPLPGIVFAAVQDYMDDNREKWERTREKRVIAGKARQQSVQHMLANASKSKQVLSGEGVSVSVSESVSVSGSVEEGVPSTTAAPNAKKPRGHYGNVMLTDEEVEVFKGERPHDWESRIQHLDEYLQDNPGKRKRAGYRDHLKKLQEWARQDDSRPPAAADTSVHFALERKQTGYEDFYTDIMEDGA